MGKPNLVVLSGAGISAESGLRTFRDSDGLWEGYDINEVATPGAWKKDPARVLDFYNMRRRDVAAARPNKAHQVLAELEKDFNVQIITQNIDDLHERGGSTRILHLHGQIFLMRSEDDPSRTYPIYEDIQLGDCDAEGCQFRPHIVWFEEPVTAMEEAIPLVRRADILAVVGTSLSVYPAAGLVQMAGPEVPVFVIDKRIPRIENRRRIIAIEAPASEGVEKMREILAGYPDSVSRN